MRRRREFLLLHLNSRLLSDGDGGFHARWSHAPQMTLTCELYAVDRELQLLLGI